MIRRLAERLDEMVIGSAARHLKSNGGAAGAGSGSGMLEAAELAGTFETLRPRRIEVGIGKKGHFEFASPFETRWPKNNVVRGRLYHCNAKRRRSTVLLIHGWNGEAGYEYLFPLLARRMNLAGMEVAMFELPFHGARKPTEPGARRNFICPELNDTTESALQAVMEIQALVRWMRERTGMPVGLWGISLGAWLAGLACCLEGPPDFSLLMAPIVRMGEAIRDLEFCEPLRRSLEGREFPMTELDLCQRRCRVKRSDVLLLAARYDRFVAIESVEQLWKAWDRPVFWAIPHGHISAMISPMTAERAVRWLAQR